MDELSPGKGRRHPGRRRHEEIEKDIAAVLRSANDPAKLGSHILAREPFIEALAQHRYGRVTRLTRGQALRDVLQGCLRRVSEVASHPLNLVADEYAKQTSIAEIARKLNRSRSHVSRDYRVQLVSMVTDEFVTESKRETVDLIPPISLPSSPKEVA